MTEPTCPVCGGASLRPSVSPPEIVVLRCTGCGHRVARHGDGTDAGVDYHAQYDEGVLEALRATRLRQSVQCIRLLERRVPHLSKIVDYGAGRGWFLEACRNARISPIAGVDTSQISVAGLAALGIEALRLAEDESGPAVLPRLSFRPRVLTLLDVVEHFPPERLQSRLREHRGRLRRRARVRCHEGASGGHSLWCGRGSQPRRSAWPSAPARSGGHLAAPLQLLLADVRRAAPRVGRPLDCGARRGPRLRARLPRTEDRGTRARLADTVSGRR